MPINLFYWFVISESKSLMLAIDVRVYLSGLLLQLNLAGKPERVCYTTVKMCPLLGTNLADVYG